LAQRDQATVLHSLCHDYFEFEQLFGSDASYFHAAKDVRQKLETFVLNGAQQTESASIYSLSYKSEVQRRTWTSLPRFKEREAAEKALELNDVIGIHERVSKMERSHVAAAGLVPAGMHRVNPKGDGKITKRNQKKKEHRLPNE
jgi:hypothetical protein